MASNRHQESTWPNVALVLVSTLVGLLMVEGAIRWIFPSVKWKAYEYVDLGWASEEYLSFDPAADPVIPGQKRILVLGDSYLAGSGVSRGEDRFPLVMQRELKDSAVIRVLATGGWGTDQELLAFLQKGIPWKPDIVLLAFTAHNDVRNNLSNSGLEGGRKPYFVADAGRLSFHGHDGEVIPLPDQSQVTAAPLRSHALDLILHGRSSEEEQPGVVDAGTRVDPRYLLVTEKKVYQREITQLATRLRGSPLDGMSNVSVYLTESPPYLEYAWALTESIVVRLDQEVKKAGAQLIVIVLPDTISPQDPRFITGAAFTREYMTPDGAVHIDMSEPNRRIAEIASHRGVETFDSTAAFIQKIHRENLVKACWPNPRDNHFSAAGHAIVADLTLKYLQSRGYL